MTDTRFTTVADDVDALLSVVDVDSVDDIETLLMILFDRPIGVDVVAEEDEFDGSLDVTVWTDDVGVTATYTFPVSMLDLVRACAESIAGMALASDDDAAEDGPDLASMDEVALITTLQRALGQVRLFTLLSADD